MSLYNPHTSRTRANTEQPPVTEFDILKASHKFLRDDTDAEASTWNDQLAKKYYDSLYREFAICDLKHYKSGNFALRWRTETEVLDGTGETSCANTRCGHHGSSSSPELTTLELPFAYEERGERKEALVKIVLCPRCVRKLVWKRRHDKSDPKETAVEAGRVAEKREEDHPRVDQSTQNCGPQILNEDSAATTNPRERRRRTSRSRSPRTRGERQTPSSEHPTRPRRQRQL
ncbi:hypothetical protein PAXRUDRAFT_828059 [Paxillus rubicundulus Ve08.2h10]|uniref:Protein FRA10AC1 n=1 Tax=Paxillus rubicundulus Ve08.2h10 TaxID=930991 RepID=A0A0D0DQ62_9AGAM|nr:hypothetical protein PAXRUDRAFT_828059 [Paxillus rubicundulus Ve08.2h10]